jgi:hypothetical protein
MAHYAFLDSNNIVVQVIVGKDEGEEGIDWESHYAQFSGMTCKRTSYNTSGGIHYSDGQPSNDQSKAFRKNYAGIGFIYDLQRDAFIPPKPFASWLLNEDTCLWEPPVPFPNDGKYYDWNEQTLAWDELVKIEGQ